MTLVGASRESKSRGHRTTGPSVTNADGNRSYGRYIANVTHHNVCCSVKSRCN